MGLRLLNRTTRKLSLTDEGSVVYERWRQILEELEDLDVAMALRRSEPTGTLKLLMPPSFGRRHVLPHLRAYLGEWPTLRAELWFTDRSVDLIEDGFDMAVRIGAPREDSQMLTRTVAWQQFVVCGAPGYLARRGIPQAPMDLVDHDTIMYLIAERHRPWQLQADGAPWVYEGRARMEADDYEAMREMAVAGFGLIHLPDYIVAEELRAGTLVEVLRTSRPAPDPIRLVYPSRRHLAPRTRGFIDVLAQHWAGGTPWHGERIEDV
jgi:DNA-binding transcriptional LysR family regulator